MNIFVLEGFNDLVFVKALLEFHFDKERVPTAHDTHFQRGIASLMKMLRNPREYRYIKTSFGVIVYGDNGKQNVISKVLPRLVRDLLGKIPEEIRLLTILDEDGVPLSQTLRKICKEITNRRIPDARIQNSTSNEILIVSTANDNYKIRIRVYLIPQSLEKQIVSQSVHFTEVHQKYGTLLEDDPHDALENIAGIIGITKDELIGKSVKEEWFREELWYTNLLKEIEDFFCFERREKNE
ncbi:hypothetical protein OCC_08999 [Thermococcus litoralis DSM 5473]|jgi:hypothetical protein|uniref:DUF4276 family protein n=1 Tax=Thermococcus litoralis (strain ATCC 51850 / DSM 5473 / JCM 8560 / NS-C) TaxID=523849 RepID=H3ZKC0_THELN|nr:hypothetical protein [Thermococcus litoralis]EHR79673.1 hypothetical protein OCC_08999 [Thermococcus litoralis DSM 5473]MDK2984014.1 hypothetical protein [Thermococcaceae archaeon]